MKIDNSVEYYNSVWENHIKNDKHKKLPLGCKWCYAVKKYAFSGKDVINDSLLEVGCGAGRFLDICHCNSYVGLDIYHSVGKIIKNKGGIGVRGNASNLPFSNSSFDICLCCEMLEHVDNPLGCLKEMYRVLRPGGKLIITVPTYFNLWYIPMMLAKLGSKYFIRFMDYQLVENMLVFNIVRKFMREYFNSVRQKAVRVEPPFFGNLCRIRIFSCLRNVISKLEESYGGSILKYFGLHTLIWGIK